MSCVHNVILVVSYNDGQVGEINELLRMHPDNQPPAFLDYVSARTGGSKHLKTGIYAGAFNGDHELIGLIIEQVMETKWLVPEEVVLTIIPQDGPAQVYRPPFSGAMTYYNFSAKYSHIFV